MSAKDEIVEVPLGDRTYSIRIGSGILDDLGAATAAVVTGRRCLVVTDETVQPLYGAQVEASLSSAGFQVTTVAVPAGEDSKKATVLAKLWETAAEAEMDRRSVVVALGGGVVGDLAGFLAASFLRGVDFVQVPTTLLAMVDSSVGGKTGINLPQGKNLVGAFLQPKLVYADLATLQTLAPREVRAGLAEVIKYGVIRDAELFGLLESRTAEILALDEDLLRHIVRRSCEIKADVVAADEREGGLRAILNFGHTIGHAVEQANGYGVVLHGEAIAIGMVFAGWLSCELGDFPEADAERLRALCVAADLPVVAPNLGMDQLRSAIAKDKKAVDAVPRFVLADALGSVRFGVDVPSALLDTIWDRQHADTGDA